MKRGFDQITLRDPTLAWFVTCNGLGNKKAIKTG